LTPSTTRALIAAALQRGAFNVRFDAPEAGTMTIEWFYLPHGAKLGSKKKPRPVLVASGKLRFGAAKTATLKIELTAAGKRLLRHSKDTRLTARGTFAPSSGKAATALKVFELK
jgi:hypothetical protein